MLRWILALLLIPFLDAVLLGVIVTQFDTLTWTLMVLLVVLTGLIGMLLVRAEGRRTLRKMQRSLAQGKPPTNELLDGGLLIASGAFLLTPGLVTDLIGFLLVVPLTRIPIRTVLKRYVIVPYMDKKANGFVSGNVWTFGFPEEGQARAQGQGQSQGTGSSTGTGAGSTDSGTYDLGTDAYTVETGDSSTSDGTGEDTSRIEFGDERSSGDPSDGESDDGDRFSR